MKRILLAASIALIFSAANAADMTPRYTKAPVAPAAGWTGFYAGLNVGYGFNDPTVTFAPNDVAIAGVFAIPPLSYNVQGVLGGVQIGYNWQISPAWLVGLEADFQGADIKGSAAAPVVAGVPFTMNVQQNVEWFGTVRARAGWLPTDKLLIFATGGFAYGAVKDSTSLQPVGAGLASTGGGFSFNCALGAGVPCIVANQTKIQPGFAAGGGLEYAAWQNVTFKVEYLYVNLGSSDRTATAVALGTPGNALSSLNAHFSVLDFHVARVGVNFRF